MATQFVAFPSVLAMPAVARILSRFDRVNLESFIAVAIDCLDLLDGDDGAEEDGLEDAFISHDSYFAYLDADNEAGAYVEWHTKPSNLRRHGQSEYLVGREDDEDDDPAEEDDPGGGNVLDEPHDEDDGV